MEKSFHRSLYCTYCKFLAFIIPFKWSNKSFLKCCSNIIPPRLCYVSLKKLRLSPAAVRAPVQG